MSKVYSIHLIALKAGASGADFERFFCDEVLSQPALSGLTLRLLKGDRGDRKGNYAVMSEFESEARRNELFPQAGPGATQMSEEFMKWMAGVGPLLAKWDQLATPIDVIYTDYVEV
jgi:hypothetical protein